MNHTLHYSRACRSLSCAAVFAAVLLASSDLSAQSPAQAAAKNQALPTLRAVAVLEWTGADPAKPKKARLVPISIYDGSELQDAGLYLSRPEPLALSSEVEYQLKQDGKTTGLFDIENAAQDEGSWVGYGTWKTAPALTHPAYAATAKLEDDDEDDDKPILHRKHHDDDSSGSSSPSSSKPADDSGRPKLHRPDSGGSSDDSDRPILHKPKPADDTAHVTPLPKISDPDRPRLIRGQDTSHALKVVPSLMGLPPDMHQTIGVSDAKDHPDHPWDYTWANPADEAKMKAALEDQARAALGLTTPPAKTPAPAHHTTTRHTTRKTTTRKTAKKSAQPATPPALAPLAGEQFRTFELAYNTGATFVLSAHTADPDPKQQKYVTLIAQPDLYGNINVLYKNVAEGAHLDDNPRMILIDAVDALADNRGELLFELRGATQRQFALFRVLRGSATQIFTTTSTPFGMYAEQ